MLDEEPTDRLIRHRAAVLAALFGSEGESNRVAEQKSESDTSRARSGVPVVERDPVDGGRAPGEPRASEQINAMLSGRPRTRPAAAASVPGPLPAAAEPSQTPPARPPASPQQRPSPPRRPVRPADQLLRDGLRALRKPKVALIAAAAMALVLILVLMIGTGSDESPQQLVIAVPNPSSAPSSAPAGPPAGANIKVVSAQATCPPGGTPGMDAFDGRPATAWSCGRSFNLDGQVLRIDLGRSYAIDSIGLVPGWDDVASDGTDQWSRYRTVSRVSYRFNDERTTTFEQRTLDQRRLVTTKIEPPVHASQVVLTVLRSSSAGAADTTAISTIVIHGH
ncbi:discoidin domain-containing protein [Nocardia brasiliensis]